MHGDMFDKDIIKTRGDADRWHYIEAIYVGIGVASIGDLEQSSV